MNSLQWISDNGYYIWAGGKGPLILSGRVDTNVSGQAQEVKAPLQNGISSYDPTLEEMEISFGITLQISGTRNVRAKAMRDEWKNIVSFAFAPNCYGTLIYNTETGENYARCRPTSKPVVKEHQSGLVEWEIELVSDYPMWQGAEQSAYMGMLEKKLIYPVVLPAVYGEYKPGVTIDNAALVEVFPVYEVYSNLETFGVTNETTGKEFSINHAIDDDEKMVIDTYHKTVTLIHADGTAEDISHYLDGDFVTLCGGLNRLVAHNQIVSENPSCKIMWRLPKMEA